ncbi:MAG: hypothetical protein WBZ40_09080 [Acidimicrobiia bacterium]
MRLSIVRRLIPAIPWAQWIPVTAIVGFLTWYVPRLQPGFDSRQLYIRAGLLLAAIAYTFTFDDPAAETTDSAPFPLRVRRLLRSLLSLLPWAALVGILLASSANEMKPVLILSSELDPLEMPVGRLTLEAATMAAWGLATAAVVSHKWDERPGWIASTALLAAYAMAWMVPDTWKPWAGPTDSRWSTALPWWWIALGLGLLVVGAASWDARRGWRPVSRTTYPQGDGRVSHRSRLSGRSSR